MEDLLAYLAHAFKILFYRHRTVTGCHPLCDQPYKHRPNPGLTPILFNLRHLKEKKIFMNILAFLMVGLVAGLLTDKVVKNTFGI
jgi:hypothetical protein